MSVVEIINELPRLTEGERRLVRQRLLELAAENSEIAQCEQVALQGALMLDHMEEQDAVRKAQ